MTVAGCALVSWVVTALVGGTLLGAWLAIPTVRRVRTARGRHRRLPPTLVFGHLAAAGGGLLVWGTFVVRGGTVCALLGLILIAATAVLGITMFVRWIPTYRLKSAPGVPVRRMTLPGRRGAHHRDSSPTPRHARHRREPAERDRNLPLVAVVAHGLLAVTTVVLAVVTVAQRVRS